MAKKQFTTMTTPDGEAFYAYLVKPEMFNGNDNGFNIQVKFDEEKTKYMQEVLEAELEAAKSHPDFKGKKWSAEPFLGFREDKNGDIIFRFKASSELKLRGGETKKRVIPVFDSTGKRVKNAEMGNGSIVKVNFSIIPFYMNNRTNGLSLRLNAVQILSLVPFGQKNAESYGFGAVEGGYVASEDTEELDPEEVFETEEPKGDF